MLDENDVKALCEALKCGVKIITSIHGNDINDIPDALKDLFDIFIILGSMIIVFSQAVEEIKDRIKRRK